MPVAFTEEFLPFQNEQLIKDVLEEIDKKRILRVPDYYNFWETTTPEERRWHDIFNNFKDIVIKDNQVFFILNNNEII